MVFHIDLDDDVDKELCEIAERSGESLHQVATRILREVLNSNSPIVEAVVIKPSADVPEDVARIGSLADGP